MDKLIKDIKNNIKKRIIGKDEAIDKVLICLVCAGHALIEDVPGLGKTTLIASLADSISCSFHRVQFTPDVLPSDIVGFNMFHLQTGEQRFHKGAVMNQIILADEINRTGPKTQAALLQAMQEGRVTVDGETYKLPEPFLVFATQNPVEMTGTYPLPEAQLDRFLLKISIGYPDKNHEMIILDKNRERSLQQLKPVCTDEEVIALQGKLNDITCSDSIKSYIIQIANETRSKREITLGMSPRGSIALMRGSMGRAMLEGRDFVLPEDVQEMLIPVAAHRIVMEAQAYVEDQSAEKILKGIIKRLPVPGVS